MQILQAVLHYYDAQSLRAHYSEGALPLTDLQIYEYVEGLLKKVLYSPDARRADFSTTSPVPKLLTVLKEEKNFFDFSKTMATRLLHELSQPEDDETRDVLLALVHDGHNEFWVMLILKGKNAYVHTFFEEEGCLGITKSGSLLPPATTKPEAWAVISLEQDKLWLKDLRLTYEGDTVELLSEVVFGATTEQSPRESLRSLKKITREISDAYAYDAIDAAANMKRYIAERVLTDDYLVQKDMAKEIFPDSELLQKRFQESCYSKDLPEHIPAPREFSLKQVAKQKLATDTGVKIEVPLKGLEDVSVQVEEDGSLTLTIRNIHRIDDK